MSTDIYVSLEELPRTVCADIESFYAETGHKDVPDPLNIVNAIDAYLRWNGIVGYSAGVLSIFKATFTETIR